MRRAVQKLTLAVFVLHCAVQPAFADAESDGRARAALAYAVALQKQAEPLPTPRVVPTPLDVTQWHVPTPDERLRLGNHWHYDHVTNLWLQHGPENNGNRNAHRGLKGNMVWEQAPPPRFVRPPQPVSSTYQFDPTQSCPAGSPH